MKRQTQPTPGCVFYVVLAALAFVGFLGGLALRSSQVWLQLVLAVLWLVLGAITLATLAVMTFSSAVDPNPIAAIGMFLVLLAGLIILVGHRAGVAGVALVIVVASAALATLIGCILIVKGIRIITTVPDRFGALEYQRLPTLAEGTVPHPEPLTPSWRLRALVSLLATSRLRGALLLPFALWTWTVWLIPELGISIHPLIGAIVISIVYYGVASAVALRDPGPVYLYRGFREVIKGNDERGESSVLFYQRALADFVAYFQSEGRGNTAIATEDTTGPGARYGVCDALIGLKRYHDAFAVATQAVDLAPDSADSHFALGKSLDKLEDRAAAVAALHRALELSRVRPQRDAIQTWLQDLESELAQAPSV